MQTFLKMRNSIQAYAWGSHHAIGDLLGLATPTDAPQAELWIGAHPKAPSQVLWQGTWRPLTEILATHATEILGPSAVAAYGHNLPYLFKVLAAAAPLSIQAHPTKAQAEAGYARENQAAIPLSAETRNYRDDNHKPECLCALTPFWALCGFREIDDIVRQMGAFLPSDLADLLTPLQKNAAADGLKLFFKQLMTLPAPARATIIAAALDWAETAPKDTMTAKWFLDLHAAYADDVGVLSPFFLNLIQLSPGQGLFIEAGILHAYLSGTGIELMANSDNVLRGGVTTKHIDVAELMRVLRFDRRPLEILTPATIGAHQQRFVCPVEEFELSRLVLEAGDLFTAPVERGVEIMLCTEGHAVVQDSERGTAAALAKGESLLVPASLKHYTVSGCAVIYKACGPVCPA